MYMWEGVAEYADGTDAVKLFPYYEDGCYSLENERQYQIEEWLIGHHEDCTYYSVSLIDVD